MAGQASETGRTRPASALRGLEGPESTPGSPAGKSLCQSDTVSPIDRYQIPLFRRRKPCACSIGRQLSGEIVITNNGFGAGAVIGPTLTVAGGGMAGRRRRRPSSHGLLRALSDASAEPETRPRSAALA